MWSDDGFIYSKVLSNIWILKNYSVILDLDLRMGGWVHDSSVICTSRALAFFFFSLLTGMVLAVFEGLVVSFVEFLATVASDTDPVALDIVFSLILAAIAWSRACSVRRMSSIWERYWSLTFFSVSARRWSWLALVVNDAIVDRRDSSFV